MLDNSPLFALLVLISGACAGYVTQVLDLGITRYQPVREKATRRCHLNHQTGLCYEANPVVSLPKGTVLREYRTPSFSTLVSPQGLYYQVPVMPAGEYRDVSIKKGRLSSAERILIEDCSAVVPGITYCPNLNP